MRWAEVVAVLVWALDERVIRGAFPEMEMLAILTIALLPGMVVSVWAEIE